jgi:phosphatidate cytidylyltransferase
VSDWRDEPEDERAERPAPGEGVRIVGPDAGGAPRRPGGPAGQPPSRFPLPGETESWSEGDATGAAPRPGDASGSNRLPHWTDPPTGEVPRIPGGDSADDDFESWSSLTAPNRQRFRTDSSDWNRGDFQAGELDHDDSTMIGALHDDEYEQAWGPPPRGRRGRGRGSRPPRAEPGGPGGPGGLEGPPSDEHGEPPREDSSADVGQRVITGVVMAIIALGAFAAGRPIAAVLVTIVIGVGAFELYDALRRAGYHTAVVIGLLGCVAMIPAAYNVGERAFPLISALVITFTMLWYLFEVVHARPTVNVALTLLVFCYVGILGGFAGLFLAAPGGTGFLGGVIICAIGSDVVAYFAGRSLGQTPLMPKISPHKTLEGLIAGAIAAVVLGGIVGGVLHPWADKGVGGGIALGLVVAVTAPIGDLVESMFKRDLRIKDLGGILPGHGGFLDRFDALLFALPAAYYLAVYLLSH